MLVELPNVWKATFSKDRGCLCAYNYHNYEYLMEPLAPNFWRAPTDNDKGGSEGTSHAARWVKAGLDRMIIDGKAITKWNKTADNKVEIVCQFEMRPDKTKAMHLETAEAAGVSDQGGFHWFCFEPSGIEEEEGPPIEAISHRPSSMMNLMSYISNTKTKSMASIPSGGNVARLNMENMADYEGEIFVESRYLISPDGSIEVSWILDTANALPGPLQTGLHQSLPRAGVHFAVNHSLHQVTWFGRGPHENYADRKSGAPSGVYTKTVKEMHVPYGFPQENGGREEVRWVALAPPHHGRDPLVEEQGGLHVDQPRSGLLVSAVSD